MAVGCFALADTENQVSDDISLTLGSVYDIDYIRRHIRTRENPKHPFFHGKVIVEKKTNDAATQMMFKFQPTSWHYGWRSSRHTKSLQHAFWVYVFVAVKESVKESGL